MQAYATLKKRNFFKGLALNSEVFSTTFSFAAMAVLKLCSSVVLTRLLYPEAYGVVAVLSSVIYIIEMLSDIGVVGLMIRHSRSDRLFLDTLWTIRFVRGFLNCGLLILAAPYIADAYGTPELSTSLRLFSLTFLIHGFQSMAFLVAMREQRARVLSYNELFAFIISTVFTIGFSYQLRNYYAMVYGTLVNSIAMTVLSYFSAGAFRPRFRYDSETAKDLFGFAKYVGPSSAITLTLSQFERIVFLKLFDLHLLGLYGIATSVAGPADALIGRLSKFVLYPRCADNHRADPASSKHKYYTQNVKLFALIMFLPAAIGGSSELIVNVLFDHRYLASAAVIQALAVRSILFSLTSPCEDVLVAAGETKVVLIGNALRLSWLVPMSLAGYHFFGFTGFIYGAVTDQVPSLLFLWWRQWRLKLVDFRFELLKFAYVLTTVLLAWLISRQLLALLVEYHLVHS